MPPKKKCTHKARKAELVFLERPREGPVQCYETPLPLAENPRCVPTKPVDQNTSATWVCPQFETTKSVVLQTCQKHRGPQRHHDWDANHSLLHAGGPCRRVIACKFPPLTFENPEGHATYPSDSSNCLTKNAECSHSQCRKWIAAEVNIQVNSLENCREIHFSPAPLSMEPVVFSPPDAETPQASFVRKWGCSSSTLLQTSGDAWHPEKELAFGIDPCGREESAPVLVTDTPEHEYGVKVTWRRRPHLMKYLQETGKLSAADMLVKVNSELSRRQTNV